MIYANFWKRLGAHIIDNIIRFIFLCIGIAIVYSGSLTEEPETGRIIAGVLFIATSWIILFFANQVWLVSKKGYSIGKKVLGIKVVDEKGKNITFGKAFLRAFTKSFLFFFAILGALGYTIPIWMSEKKQSAGDFAANTFVVEA